MMDTPKAYPIPPQPRHEEERAHKRKEHEEKQPRATDEAGQVRANVSPLFFAPAESNPRSDGNRQAHEPERASARGTASVSEPWSKGWWSGKWLACYFVLLLDFHCAGARTHARAA